MYARILLHKRINEYLLTYILDAFDTTVYVCSCILIRV
jgi:hypothetical protein